MTLLTICQDAANIIGIPQPAAVTSSTDTSVIQLLSVANQEGKSLVRSYPWNVITKEGSFTTAAAESQGAMTTIATVSSGVTNYFRFRGNLLIIQPNPTVSQSVFFEYISKNWVIASGSSANADKFSGDSQTSVLEEDLITLGVVWRFLKIKGLPYEQQYVEYQTRLADYQMQDGAKPILQMGGPRAGILEVNEPEGNYAGVS